MILIPLRLDLNNDSASQDSKRFAFLGGVYKSPASLHAFGVFALLTGIRILVPLTRHFMLIPVVVANGISVRQASLPPLSHCDWTYT